MSIEDDKQQFYNSMPWRRMRERIRKRDGYECQWCKLEGRMTIDEGELNRNGRKKMALIVHHIKEYELYPELKLDEDNLVLVCFQCHERHHGRWRDNKPKKWPDEKWEVPPV